MEIQPDTAMARELGQITARLSEIERRITLAETGAAEDRKTMYRLAEAVAVLASAKAGGPSSPPPTVLIILTAAAAAIGAALSKWFLAAMHQAA